MRRALVCGASGGIGRATAVALAEKGVEVVALARRLPRLLELQSRIDAFGGPQATVLACDLSEPPTFVDAINDVLSRGPIHILINNSGGPSSGPLLQAGAEVFERAFAQHVLAAHRLTRMLLPGMEIAGFGRIVNVISTSVREPIPNLGVSNTIRGAMASWAKSMSRELPPNITINNILPGFTDTGRLRRLRRQWALEKGVSEEELVASWLSQVPEGRLCDPSETAEAICFLASESSGYIRGVSLPVDGGRMRSI